MSVRFIRTARTHGGDKMREAVAWAKEIAGYVETHFGTGKVGVYLDAFGAVGTIRWMMDLPDLAAVDKVFAQMMTDGDYWKMLAKAYSAQLFIDGTAEDSVLRSL